MIKTETYYIIQNKATGNFLACHPLRDSFLTGYMETTASESAQQFGSTMEDGEKLLVEIINLLDESISYIDGLGEKKTSRYYQTLLKRFNKLDLVLVKADVVTKTELTTIIKER